MKKKTVKNKKKRFSWKEWQLTCEFKDICSCEQKTEICFHDDNEGDCKKEGCPTWKNRHKCVGRFSLKDRVLEDWLTDKLSLQLNSLKKK